MLDQFIEAIEIAIKALKKWPSKTVHLFHHNDADGLSSGAILTRAFERAGYETRRVCLEKPYPDVLKKIYEKKGRIIVFADFAGRIAPMLCELNQGKNLTLILDHHVARPSGDPNVYNLDPELFGLKGDRDITASTTCYLFARTMDPGNRDLAHIAVLGAVGDGFFINNRLVSCNRDVVLESVSQKMLEIRTHGTGEQYILNTPGGQVPCEEMTAYLNILGAAGYYQQGPEMGIRACLKGPAPESDRMYDALKSIQRAAFDEETSRLGAGALKQTPHIQWFHVKSRFAPMGVKMIGTFCEAIKQKHFIDPRRYIAGFQLIPDEIPGMGDFKLNQVKISMRVSQFLEGQIRQGQVVGLNVLLPEATDRLGGFSDACHSLAAATTVKKGKEEALIREMESILSG